MKATISKSNSLRFMTETEYRTTVFFKGRPLKCVWCHNPEGLEAQKQLSYLDHKCIGCGACVSVCSEGVHTLKNGVHEINRERIQKRYRIKVITINYMK